MKKQDIHPTFQEALGAHEAFRRLGFPSAQIFVHLNSNGEMLVILDTPEGSFAVRTGMVNMPKEEWVLQWGVLAEAVRDGSVSEEDLQSIWRSCLPYRHSEKFVAGILDKGIRIPKLQPN